MSTVDLLISSTKIIYVHFLFNSCVSSKETITLRSWGFNILDIVPVLFLVQVSSHAIAPAMDKIGLQSLSLFNGVRQYPHDQEISQSLLSEQR